MKVEGIGQIGLTVKDLAKAKAFYGGVLGLSFLFDAGAMTFYQCGDVRLMLGTAEPGKEGPIGGTILYLLVAGIEAVVAELKKAGVRVVQEAHPVARMADHELWMAFVKDPDGNAVGLMEEKR